MNIKSEGRLLIYPEISFIKLKNKLKKTKIQSKKFKLNKRNNSFIKLKLLLVISFVTLKFIYINVIIILNIKWNIFKYFNNIKLKNLNSNSFSLYNKIEDIFNLSFRNNTVLIFEPNNYHYE